MANESQKHFFQIEIDEYSIFTSNWNSFLNKISEINTKLAKQIDTEASIRTSENVEKDSSLQDVTARIAYFPALLNRLLNVKETKHITENLAYGILREIRKANKELTGILERLEKPSKSYSFDENTWVLTTDSALPLGNSISTIYTSIDTAIDKTNFILSTTGKSNATVLYDILSEKNKISKLTKELTAAFSMTRDIEKSSIHSKSAIDDTSRKIEAAASRINDTVHKALHSNEIINDILTRSDDLDKQIQSASFELSKFKSEMTSSEATIEKLIRESQNLQQSSEKIHSNVKTLLHSSEQLLAGATNSALAASFKEIMDITNTELEKSRKHFFLSIIFLFISTLPLVAHIIITSIHNISPEFFENSIIEGFAKSGLHISSLIAYIAMIYPGIWASRFTSSRHADLFRIREDYAYKYSIAKGVDGYKKQAPRYADEITAATFKEISFNPADNMVGYKKCSTHPNPILNKIIARLCGETGQHMQPAIRKNLFEQTSCSSQSPLSQERANNPEDTAS